MPQLPLFTGASASRPPDDVAVVLVHGYLCVWPGLYWYGLRPLRRSLLARGIPVLTSRQPRTASVELRAGRLASLLERLPHRRLVLVGHSMGGLDTRWVASRHDPQRRITHVVTVGTPHRGTRLAEWASRAPPLRAPLPRPLDRRGLRALTPEGAPPLRRDIPHPPRLPHLALPLSLRALTPEGAARLGDAMPDRPDVTYLSLAGSLSAPDLPPFFRPLGELLHAAEGANDGLVGVRSAAWGTSSATVAADHLGLIGATVAPAGYPQRDGARQALAALYRLVGRAALSPGARPAGGVRRSVAT